MASAGQTLDVRTIPIWERHPRIFAAFTELAPDQSLTIVSDHEPRPLRRQFEERYGGRFRWEQRQFGDGRWQVEITWSAPRSGSESASALARSALFGPLPESTIDELAYRARRASVKRHHSIIEQGVLWPYVGIVESGTVRAVLTTPTGREHAVYDVLPGECFGEFAMLDSGVTPLRYVALTQSTTVVLIPVVHVHPLLGTDAALNDRLRLVYAQHVRAILSAFAASFSESATSRVARALLPYAPPAQGMGEALAPLPTMTQLELAAAAGTVKEVVSRALAELEEAGALARERGHITLLDRERLCAAIDRETS